MATIWKSPLQLIAVQQIMVPLGAEMLCAREQFEEICVWYRCDPRADRSPRTFAVVATGGPSHDDDGRYLGTASLHGGKLIFHVFEKLETAIAR